ncbi:unnamed protein product [Arctia plantaginis]|uniref:Uncharacterized protein n=1 Tax=Arctia plantaginis TaxID=874455 RepID=A0A8S0YP57_ARCPL|nr:unnamed protein product [Arctia plantaginis]CAB3245341.1 unnamed protein product [Arctia plantaginis]
MRYLVSVFVVFCSISCVLLKELPEYIQVCKRDPSTLDDCILKSIEAIKPRIILGIPELGVPAIDPFLIPEIKAPTTDNLNIRFMARDVKVTGGGDFKIKSLSVDLDSLTIKAHIRFPKLHFEGDYKIDGQILIVPLNGEGKFHSDAVKCDAELIFRLQVVPQDGVDYLKFNKIDIDINVRDYRIKLDGLFNGDKSLGDAANAAINQNRGEFLKVSKPYLEKTVSKFILDVANKVVDGLTLDQLLPKP